MNLYVQFFSQEQTGVGLELIRIPCAIFNTERASAEISVAAGGSVRKFRVSDIKAAITELAATQFNELEIVYKPNPRDQPNETGVVALNGVFYPSVTSALWLPSTRFSVNSQAAVARRSNARAKESCLEMGITPIPMVFEVVLRLGASQSPQEILDIFATRLYEAIVKQFADLDVFGCCDIGGTDFFVRLESGVPSLNRIRVMAKILPTEYPNMGRKFEGLHPLIFGNRAICTAIASRLGDDVVPQQLDRHPG